MLCTRGYNRNVVFPPLFLIQVLQLAHSWWDSLRNEENEKSISNLSLLYIAGGIPLLRIFPHTQPCIYLIFCKNAGGTLRLLDDITWHFVLPYIGQFLVHLFLSFTFLWCCFITSQHTCPCSSEMKMHFREIVILPLFLSQVTRFDLR